MENETLKVQHGALVAMMATRCRNMYIPKTSTVVGGVAIGKVISNSIRHLETLLDIWSLPIIIFCSRVPRIANLKFVSLVL